MLGHGLHPFAVGAPPLGSTAQHVVGALLPPPFEAEVECVVRAEEDENVLEIVATVDHLRQLLDLLDPVVELGVSQAGTRLPVLVHVVLASVHLPDQAHAEVVIHGRRTENKHIRRVSLGCTRELANAFRGDPAARRCRGRRLCISRRADPLVVRVDHARQSDRLSALAVHPALLPAGGARDCDVVQVDRRQMPTLLNFTLARLLGRADALLLHSFLARRRRGGLHLRATGNLLVPLPHGSATEKGVDDGRENRGGDETMHGRSSVGGSHDERFETDTFCNDTTGVSDNR